MSNIKDGDRVRILPTADFQHSQSIGEAGDVQIVEKLGTRCVYTTTRSGSGKQACWNDDEIELVTTQGDKPVARRTFKQLKDDTTVRKGALYQEECEDGSQPYALLDTSFHKAGNTVKINSRSLVEDAPEWFVEVFKVEPEYMTREELDKYEAFVKEAKRSVGRPKGSKNSKRK